MESREILDELRSAARDVARTVLRRYAYDVDLTGRFPEESLAAVVDAGLHVVGLPHDLGGGGQGLVGSAVVAEELARGCTTTQQIVGGDELFAWPLLLSGDTGLANHYLPRIGQGELLGAFALSEPDAGSDIAAMRTRAYRTDAGWRLKGTKRWITNAGRADVYVVFAVTDSGVKSRSISAFVVETGDGVSFGPAERKMGLHGSPTADVQLDIEIPENRLVGELGQGLQLALGTLDRTRCVVAAQAVGIAQAAIDEVLAHGMNGTSSIPSSQALQFQLADLETRVRAARLLTLDAARESEVSGPDMTLAGASAKCFASDTAMYVTNQVTQMLGDRGYTDATLAERLFRDAKITQIYEGTNQIQRIVIAREVLGRRRKNQANAT